MKANKKNKLLLWLLMFSILVIIVLVVVNNNDDQENEFELTEYTPQEEISNEQLRQTLITLYFTNKETGSLTPEARMIDSKILINNPYESLINLLIEGPKNQNLNKLIPDGTKVNSVRMEKGIVYIDFSEEFINTGTMGAETEEKVIYSIVNTLTELTEVNGVKILINGEADKEFESGILKFNEIFVRKTNGAI